jgi:hypothetical protein
MRVNRLSGVGRAPPSRAFTNPQSSYRLPLDEQSRLLAEPEIPTFTVRVGLDSDSGIATARAVDFDRAGLGMQVWLPAMAHETLLEPNAR